MTRGDEALFAAVAAISEDLELRGVLERVVEAAVEVSGARYGALGVLARRGGRLDDFVHVGVSERTASLIGDLPTGHGVLGKLIRDPEPLVLDRISDHPDSVALPPGHPPMETFLGVPLRIGGSVFGNLYLTEKEGGFDELDVQRIEALAVVAGSAIRNARTLLAERWSARLTAATADLSLVALSGAPVDEVLAHAVTAAREVLDGSIAVLVTRTPSGPVVEHAAGRDDADPRLLTAAEEARDEARAFRGVVAAPLMDDEVAPGGVLVVATDADLPDDMRAPLVAVTEQARLALAYARARDKAESIAVGSERDRIARDLHDTVIQRLFAAGLRLDAASVGAPEELANDLTAAIEEVDASIRDLRGLVAGLGGVGESTVGERLRSVTSTLSAVTTAVRPLELRGDVDALPDRLASALPPVLREAITNAARHAAADTIEASVVVGDQRVVVEVVDDGVGPGDDAVDGRTDGTGLGLRNLVDRAAQFGGGCELVPGPGGVGARFRWWAPLGA